MVQPDSLLAGRYRIVRTIGTGGMGSVFAATDERLGREVAIKVLRPDLATDPVARGRFLTEAQIASQVDDPHIVRTYDVGDDAASPFLVQELLHGRTLDQALPLPVDRAIAVIDGIAGALDALHKRGFVHCDVKPQNIWLRPNGEPVLLDFGIAKVEGAQTTTLIATPSYLAPERASGAPPSAAADLYGLGVVMYQTLTGRLPFEGATLEAVLQAHRDMPVPTLGIVEPMAPQLDRLIGRLLAKHPKARPRSAAALQRDLRAIKTGLAAGGNRPAAPLPITAAVSVGAPKRAPLAPVTVGAGAAGGTMMPSAIFGRGSTRWLGGMLGLIVLAALMLHLHNTPQRGTGPGSASGATQPGPLAAAPPVIETTIPTATARAVPSPSPAQPQVAAPALPSPTPAQPQVVVPVVPAPSPAQPQVVAPQVQPPGQPVQAPGKSNEHGQGKGKGKHK